MIGGPATQQNVSPWHKPAAVEDCVVSMVVFSPLREGNVFYFCITWLFFSWFIKQLMNVIILKYLVCQNILKVMELFFVPDGLQ